MGKGKMKNGEKIRDRVGERRSAFVADEETVDPALESLFASSVSSQIHLTRAKEPLLNSY
jgi:hypothetical protein